MGAKETLVPCISFPFEKTPKSPEASESKTGYQQQ